MRRCLLPIVCSVLIAGCATEDRNFPSLAPRAAESIDPRLPVGGDPVVGPADAALSAQLANLVGQARSGVDEFAAAASNAENLASGAGPAQSESWVVAQQALSAAVAARLPVTRALGDIDAIAATALAREGGIAPGNFAAIRQASATVGEIDRDQASRLSRIEARLAR